MNSSALHNYLTLGFIQLGAIIYGIGSAYSTHILFHVVLSLGVIDGIIIGLSLRYPREGWNPQILGLLHQAGHLVTLGLHGNAKNGLRETQG